jgi:hypothetical protein
MILNGNQRGHGRNLALHLMKAENEVVQVHDLRGFVSRDLIGAFNEIHAISRATRCEQYLYSLSLNTPPNAKVSNADFESAIEEAEKRLGLSGQPRAVVFHEKQGRRHCHVVWSRIDLETMKAKQMSFDREKLTEFSRELYLQHGWQMPRGLAQRGQRDPKNYTFAERQQAQRIGKNAGQIKAEIQGAWAASDSKAAFESALAEIGYILARGDRRSFVVADMAGEVYSLPRMLGIKTKEVRARLGDPQDLPSLEDVQKMLAERQKQEEIAETPPQKQITKDDAFAEILHHHAAFTRKMAERTLKAIVPDEERRQEFLDEILKQKDVCKIGRHKGEAVYANQDMVDLENRMMEISQDMAQTKSCEADDHALRHMTNDKQLSLIVGVAGAGKTTIMQGAKEALESQVYRVRGAAPSGIAAAGTPSRVPSSLRL